MSDDRYHRRLFVFLGVASFFEGFDTFALTQLLPAIRAEMGLSPSDAGWLVGAICAGSILSYGLVRYADRAGRRGVLAITILGYAVCTALTALARGPFTFGAAQIAARFFLIAEWALSLVVAAEEFPADRRGLYIGVLNALTGVGAIVCAGITPAVVQSPLGWRGIYVLGTAPLFLLAVARRSLRETRRFTEQVEGTKLAKRPFTQILSPPHRNRMLLLAAIWMLTYACTTNAIMFWKEHAMGERGYTEGRVGLYISIAAVAGLPLAFISAKLLDTLGRRGAAVLIYLWVVAGTAGCYLAGSSALVLISLVFAMGGITATGSVLAAYNTELFPTELRSDAFGWSNHLFGRTAQCVTPVLVGYAAESVGWAKAVSSTVVFPVLAIALILLTLPETRGRELEDIA
ncbi:MFS transporter [Polyangium mundeleinium]|uniref:MFS transporter n=1 Tax=Polyangium mundeleinium TaxID=2995306 RepID=A0ABT5EXC0_9BACT|nr:MFS transporter [Polyangium mundeleinium]MDC0746446.1 MFS transporter [Polyangium mundeleinium]